MLSLPYLKYLLLSRMEKVLSFYLRALKLLGWLNMLVKFRKIISFSKTVFKPIYYLVYK